jgi:hypothetical protein
MNQHDYARLVHIKRRALIGFFAGLVVLPMIANAQGEMRTSHLWARALVDALAGRQAVLSNALDISWRYQCDRRQ